MQVLAIAVIAVYVLGSAYLLLWYLWFWLYADQRNERRRIQRLIELERVGRVNDPSLLAREDARDPYGEE